MKDFDSKFDKAAIGKRITQSAEFLFPGRGSKSRLAEALLMKPGAFQKYYTGTTMPGAEILNRLNQLGVNINWLLTGDGDVLIDSKVTQAKSNSHRVSEIDKVEVVNVIEIVFSMVDDQEKRKAMITELLNCVERVKNKHL